MHLIFHFIIINLNDFFKWYLHNIMSSNFFLSTRNLSVKISSSSVSPNIVNNSSRFSLYPLLPDVLPVRPVPVSDISDKLSVLAYDGLMIWCCRRQLSVWCITSLVAKACLIFTRSRCKTQLTLFVLKYLKNQRV